MIHIQVENQRDLCPPICIYKQFNLTSSICSAQWAGSHVPPALYSSLGPKDKEAVIARQSTITVGQLKLIFLSPSDKANTSVISFYILQIQEWL